MGLPNPYTRYSSKQANSKYNTLIRKELFTYKNPHVTDVLKKNNALIETFRVHDKLIGISSRGATKPSIFYIFVAIVLFVTLIVLLYIYRNK